ncbi:MAG: hypothetical protein U1A27_00215 [Phycisphaerae bacterium]
MLTISHGRGAGAADARRDATRPVRLFDAFEADVGEAVRAHADAAPLLVLDQMLEMVCGLLGRALMHVTVQHDADGLFPHVVKRRLLAIRDLVSDIERQVIVDPAGLPPVVIP